MCQELIGALSKEKEVGQGPRCGHGGASAGLLSRGAETGLLAGTSNLNIFFMSFVSQRTTAVGQVCNHIGSSENHMATRSDLLTVREYFSSDEWDIIDAALSEYQDHYDTDEEAATYNTLVGRISHLFTINTDATD